MDVKISVDKKDIARIKAYPRDAENAIFDTFEKMMLKAEGVAKEKYFKEGGKVSPTILTSRTGSLRRIISSEVERKSTSIYAALTADVDYAAKHEYGDSGSNMPARPFLTPAIEDVFKGLEFENMLRSELDKRLGGV